MGAAHSLREMFATCLGVVCSTLQSGAHQKTEAEQPHPLAESHPVACGPARGTSCSHSRIYSRQPAADELMPRRGVKRCGNGGRKKSRAVCASARIGPGIASKSPLICRGLAKSHLSRGFPSGGFSAQPVSLPRSASIPRPSRHRAHLECDSWRPLAEMTPGFQFGK